MRDDMDKLLVTRPRHASSVKNGEVRKQRRGFRDGDEELPTYSSMKPKGKTIWRRELNEYLNPLLRYLSKACGRPWNKIYSDICKNMDKRGTVQEHIFQHLFQYVELHPIFEDGKVYQLPFNWQKRELVDNGYTFYVDKFGFLRKPKTKPGPWPRSPKHNPAYKQIRDDSNRFYAKRSDGVWFEVTLEKKDGWLDPRPNCPEWLADLTGLYLVNTTAILRTLSKKEKKKLNLK